MMQDAFAGGDGLIVQYLAHQVREGDRQIVRLGMPQADGKAGLGVTVHGQHLLPGLGQPNAEIGTSCAFARTAFLIDYGDHLGVHVFSTPLK